MSFSAQPQQKTLSSNPIVRRWQNFVTEIQRKIGFRIKMISGLAYYRLRIKNDLMNSFFHLLQVEPGDYVMIYNRKRVSMKLPAGWIGSDKIIETRTWKFNSFTTRTKKLRYTKDKNRVQITKNGYFHCYRWWIFKDKWNTWLKMLVQLVWKISKSPKHTNNSSMDLGKLRQVFRNKTALLWYGVVFFIPFYEPNEPKE